MKFMIKYLVKSVSEKLSVIVSFVVSNSSVSLLCRLVLIVK